MFAQVEWSDGPVPTGPLCDDEPPLTEADYQAMVEQLIAADPDARPAPSTAEIIARGESEPMSPALIAALETIDRDQLDEDLLVGFTKAWERAGNYTDAQQGLAVAATVAACPDDPRIPRELHAAGQLGAVLGLGSGGTDTLIAASCQIAERLPSTRAMCLTGNLPWRKASSLAMGTLTMTAEQAARVEAKVLPKAAERSPARHDAAVRRAVEQVDPGRADRDRKERERDIRMVTHHYGAGMGQVFLDAPSEWVATIRVAADAYARRLKAAGDPRTLEFLHAHYFYAAATSQVSHGDPTYCGRICDPLPPTTRRRRPRRLARTSRPPRRRRPPQPPRRAGQRR